MPWLRSKWSLILTGLPILAGLIVAACISIFFASQWQSLTIDTDITKLAPRAQVPGPTYEAVQKINQNIQPKVLLLVRDKTQRDLDDIIDDLLDALDTTGAFATDIQEQSTQAIIEFIEEQRFSLLTQRQLDLINQTTNPEALAEQFYREKFSINATPQIIGFDIDPTGWHSEYLLSVVSQLDLSSEQDSYTAITLTLLANKRSIEENQQLATQVTNLVNQVSEHYPQAEIFYSGIFFYATDAATKSKADISFISSLSTAGIVLLFIWVFRSFIALAMPIISIVMGVAAGFIAVHSWYGSVHVLTIVFGAGLMGIAVDYALHYLCHSQGEQGGGLLNQDAKPAKLDSKKQLHAALLLSLLTSAIGYCALAFTQLPALAQVALFSVVGLATAWVTVIGLGAWMRTQFKTHTLFKAHTHGLDRMIASVCNLLAYLPTKAVLGGALLLLLSALAAERLWLKTQDNPGLFLSPNPDLVQMDQAINAIDQQLEPGTFIVVSGNNSDDVYLKVAAFKQSLAAYDLSEGSVFSITELLPSEPQQQLNREYWQQLMSPDGPVVQYLAKLNLAPDTNTLGINTLDIDTLSTASPADLIKSAPNSLPPLWYEHDHGVTNLLLIRQGTDLATLARVAASKDGVYYFRALDEASRALKSQRQAAMIALLVAYTLVSFGLLMRYRRWHVLAIVALPAVATAAVIVVMSGLAMPLTIFHVMAFYLVLGLGLDYGIFVYAMNKAQRTTRQAIFLSALTSSLSFGLLALSSMPLVQSFGLTLLLANTVNCLGAFFYSTKLANQS